MVIRMLPSGYHTNHKPNSESFRDWPGCLKGTCDKIFLLDSCWNFFQVACMPPVCIICQSYLKDQLHSLGPVILQGLFLSKDNVVDEEARDEIEDEHQESDSSSQVIPINIITEEVLSTNWQQLKQRFLHYQKNQNNRALFHCTNKDPSL